MMLISKDRVLRVALAIGCLVGLFGAKSAAGQSSEGIVLTINQVNDIAYPTVEVFVSVSDQTGAPLEGLTEDDFELFQDGQAVDNFQIAAVDAGEKAISVVLAIDTSGSMARLDGSGQSALSVAQEAAISFVNSLAVGRDRVAVFSFSSEVQLVQSFSSDLAVLEEAVGSLTAEGETRLNDATYEAIELAAALPPGRKAVVVLTDGQDTESRLTLDDAKDRAQGSNIPVYAVAFGPETDPRPLERLARLTGGRYMEALETAGISSSFQTIADQLREQYGITFLADAPADGSRHEIGLRVNYQGLRSQGLRSFVARPNPAAISISTPVSGEELSGSIVISPTFQMPGLLAQIAFFVDGLLEEVVTAPPYSYVWDSRGVSGGQHLLEVRATDHVGNQAEASTLITVVPPLTVSLTQPEEGQEVVGPSPIAVVVEDAFNGVSQVEFYLNGELIETLGEPPFETLWDPGLVDPGPHVISVVVRDVEGNQVERSATVTVPAAGDSLSATFAGVTEGQQVRGSIPLAVTLESAVDGVDRVEFLQGDTILAVVSEEPYETQWETEGLQPGEYVLGARVYDSQGNRWEDRVRVVIPAAQSGLPWQIIAASGAVVFVVLVFATLVVRRKFRARQIAEMPPAADEETLPTESSPVTATRPVQEHPVGDLIDPFEGRLVERLRELDTVALESAPFPKTGKIGDAKKSAIADSGRKSAVEHPSSDSRPRFPAYFIATHQPTGRIVEYPLREGETLIGRSKDVDIMLPDTKVSRRHARVRYEAGRFLLFDLGATNPTMINGEAYREPRQIEDGDEIIVGETRLVFRLSGS